MAEKRDAIGDVDRAVVVRVRSVQTLSHVILARVVLRAEDGAQAGVQENQKIDERYPAARFLACRRTTSSGRVRHRR